VRESERERKRAGEGEREKELDWNNLVASPYLQTVSLVVLSCVFVPLCCCRLYFSVRPLFSLPFFVRAAVRGSRSESELVSKAGIHQRYHVAHSPDIMAAVPHVRFVVRVDSSEMWSAMVWSVYASRAAITLGSVAS